MATPAETVAANPGHTVAPQDNTTSSESHPTTADVSATAGAPSADTTTPVATAATLDSTQTTKTTTTTTTTTTMTPTADPAAAQQQQIPQGQNGSVTAPASVPVPEQTPTPAGNIASPKNDGIDDMNPRDFSGAVQTNNDLPSAATLRKIENYAVLDRHGKSHTFRSLYSGRNVARRVLIIFVRHFFCGNCQGYLRTLSASITPEALLNLPIPTFIAVVGCGDPALIDMYVAETGCRFPVYTDPTRRLFTELGMVRSLAPGSRPAYQRRSMISSALNSVVQGLRQIPNGRATKGGDQRQIGGEFLFEPLTVSTPAEEVERRLGEHRDYRAAAVTANLPPHAASEDTNPVDMSAIAEAAAATATATTLATNGKPGSISAPPEAQIQFEDETDEPGEEKQVTWAHRMRTTRDHAEVPELMEVLGLDGQGMPIKDKKRWSRALETRKGTGLSMASQMSALSASRSAAAAASRGNSLDHES